MTATNGNTSKQKQPAPEPPLPPSTTPGEVKLRVGKLPLGEVVARKDWNSRSTADAEETIAENLGGFDAERETTGMGGVAGAEAGLIDLIRAQGQLDPVDVRPLVNPKTGARSYDLCAGFRRHAALTQIAKEGVRSKDYHPIKADPAWDAREPTILCVVRPFSEYEARIRNLNEGTSHKALSPPDLTYGLMQLAQAAKIDGRILTAKSVAGEIAKSPGYISLLLSIGRLPERVVTHWRSGGVFKYQGVSVSTTTPLNTEAMRAVTMVDTGPDDQEKLYAELLAGRKKKTEEKKQGEDARFEKAQKKARDLAKLVAWIGYSMHSPEAPNEGDWELVLEDLVAYKQASGRAVSAAKTAVLMTALKEAYESELARLSGAEDGADDEEDEEQAEKKRGKRDGGR